MKKPFLILYLFSMTMGSFSQVIDYTLYAQWSSTDSIWKDNLRRTYSYENENMMMIFSEYLFPDSTEWNPIERTINSYSTDQTISESLRELWNVNSNNWETDSRITYSYNNEGSVLVEVNENWINEAWLPEVKTENNYNSNNIVTERYLSFWDTLASDWLLTYKDQYTYDENGKVTNLRSDIFQNSEWVYLSELNYSYTEFGKIAITATPIDTAGDETISGTRTLYTYDAGENLTHKVRESIYASTQSWRPVLQFNYVNNADGSVNSSIRQINMGTDSVQWVNFGMLSYFYINPSIVNKVEPLVFNLFPNPAGETVYIQMEDLQRPVYFTILNMLGKAIVSGSITSADNSVSTANLVPGVYLIELRSVKKTVVSKLVKE